MKQLKNMAVMMLAVMLLPMVIACGGDDAKEGDKGSATNPENSNTYVYFATQYPVRYIVLGNMGSYDNTLDNEHKCMINATIGSLSYSDQYYQSHHVESINGYVELAVDESLVKNLYMEDGITPVKAMPRNYYSLSSSTIEFVNVTSAGVIVELSDAFFKDPDAVKNTYVIPLVMKSQTGFGKIKTGKLKDGLSGSRTNPKVWDLQPMDFVLYCVKYTNKYSGVWITNGTNSIKDIYYEYYEKRVKSVILNTKSLNECVFSVSYQDGSKEYKADLLVAFDSDDDCTISSLTNGVSVTGNGRWLSFGAKNKLTGFQQDRDLLELSYTIDFGNGHVWTIHERLIQPGDGVGYNRGIEYRTVSFYPVYRD